MCVAKPVEQDEQIVSWPCRYVFHNRRGCVKTMTRHRCGVRVSVTRYSWNRAHACMQNDIHTNVHASMLNEISPLNCAPRTRICTNSHHELTSQTYGWTHTLRGVVAKEDACILCKHAVCVRVYVCVCAWLWACLRLFACI